MTEANETPARNVPRPEDDDYDGDESTATIDFERPPPGVEAGESATGLESESAEAETGRQEDG